MDQYQGNESEPHTALARYQDWLDESNAKINALTATDGRFATVRLVLFGIAAIVLAFAFFSQANLVVWITGFAAFAGFLVAAILNEPVRDAMGRERRSAEVTSRLIARVKRDWPSLDWNSVRKKLASVELAEHQKDVADDLDLLGKSSLFQLVSMAGTTVGVRTLASWLTGVADAQVAEQRSAAIRRLAPRRDQRMRFYSLAKHVGEGTGDPDEFLNWTASAPWLDSHRWLVIWARISAILSMILIVILIGSRVGIVSQSVAQISLIAIAAVVVINVLLTTVMLGPAHQIFSVAMASRDSVDEYRELFAAADWLSDQSNEDGSSQAARNDERLTALRRILVEDPEQSARIGMDALRRVAALGSLRSSAATFLLYLPLQAFGLWDVFVLQKLEAWQQTYGESAPRWFEAFGELEALMSLAALHDEHPDWVFPQWEQGGHSATFESRQLGHPLLTDETRVCNDVAIGPPGTVLLVTGSNMSGKSTMLRSVGLNVALAGTGAPVCAQSLRLPSTELATSIRVRDNLAEGVSFYMAELKRLKGVVDRARGLAENNHVTSLFLLDEILQGTNSRERQIAVTQVLQHLIDCGAIGAISTHDLELADEPELSSLAQTVHFRETIEPDAEGNEAMTFDYKMRSGVSPTTNALRLLAIVGLNKDSNETKRNAEIPGEAF